MNASNAYRAWLDSAPRCMRSCLEHSAHLGHLLTCPRSVYIAAGPYGDWSRPTVRRLVDEAHSEALIDDMTTRIVRRAQYDALKAALAQIDAWEAQGATLSPEVRERGAMVANAFREMLNATARELGTTKPWRGDQ